MELIHSYLNWGIHPFPKVKDFLGGDRVFADAFFFCAIGHD